MIMPERFFVIIAYSEKAIKLMLSFSESFSGAMFATMDAFKQCAEVSSCEVIRIGESGMASPLIVPRSVYETAKALAEKRKAESGNDDGESGNGNGYLM